MTFYTWKIIFQKWTVYFADKKNSKIMLVIQVNLFQKPSFLHLLSHNFSRDCSLNSPKNTNSQHVVYKNVCFFCFDIQNNICTQNVLILYFSRNSMNNFLSYCGLTDLRMRASEKDLPVCSSFYSYFLWRTDSNISCTSRSTNMHAGKKVVPLCKCSLLENYRLKDFSDLFCLTKAKKDSIKWWSASYAS